ncbi:MAG TPA: DUF2520 domain-containing protein [Candidatus Kapabacteria bacterium]|nr:DUF2520 domain-containing protein [Candidatus Kapabacteria bacterium]
MSTGVASPRLALVGSGRLARAIIRTFPNQVQTVLVRSAAPSLPGVLDPALATVDPVRFADAGMDVLWIATADGALARVAAMLAPLRESWKGVAVVHSSGATSRAVLDPFAARGARTMVLHPNGAFTGQEAISPGLVWGISSNDPGAAEFVLSLLHGIEPRPVMVAEEHQALYHAAASMASNYSVTLFAAAEELYRRAGIDPAMSRDIVARYMRESLERAAVAGAGRALTGPIVRGDEAVVRAQRDAIAAVQPSLLPLFDAFADLTRRLAAERPDET